MTLFRTTPLALIGLFALAACSPDSTSKEHHNLGVVTAETSKSLVKKQKELDAARREELQKQALENGQAIGVSSPETQALVESNVSKVRENRSPDAEKSESAQSLKKKGWGHFGLLYYRDQPAHEKAVLDWLKENEAEILFQDEALGYVEASLKWERIQALMLTSGNLGLPQSSFMKLEVQAAEESESSKSSRAGARAGTELPSEGDFNSGWLGPVHNAGYGSKVEEFKVLAAKDLGLKAEDLEGQGTRVAIFDAGVDASRTDVFQNRLADFVVGDESDWKTAQLELSDMDGKISPEALTQLRKELGENSTLRFVSLEESWLAADLNLSGTATDSLWLAVYWKEPFLSEARFLKADGKSFGPAVQDFAIARKNGLNPLIDLKTGELLSRTLSQKSPSAVGLKFRTSKVTKQNQGQAPLMDVAFVGLAPNADHGIANLHMVGGNFVQGKVQYRGVATQTEFVGVQPWRVEQDQYGSRWIPLARSVVESYQKGVDVLDLDIYTPGDAVENGMISEILCRITAESNVVPVVAAHNFGAQAQTVQSLAQSPCVLGIGAAHSVASQKARNRGSVDPSLKEDDLVTAMYSGRGFGLNGLMKPDILAPAYGITAYGKNFIRFAGTSGATPTTAGMIVLLKQAARKMNLELGLEQIRYLLQGASSLPQSVRDGYGYVDLSKSWELLKQLKEKSELGRFSLSGQTPLIYEGRPTQDLINLNLSQRATLGAEDTVQPMMFWIEFSGPKGDWLSFFDPAAGSKTQTLSKDIPLAGEQQLLRLSVNLSAEAYAKLPPGEYVALVKGVRQSRYLAQADSLAGNQNPASANATPFREVDFLQPVSFTKGAESTDSTFKVPPLFVDGVHRMSLVTKPGDVLFMSMDSKCSGVSVKGPQENFELQIDNEKSYSHASSVMNDYAPISVGQTPVRVVAQRSLTNLVFSRSSQDNCQGAKSGTLRVRRMSLDNGPVELSFSSQAEDVSFLASRDLVLRGAALNELDYNRNAAWKFASGSALLERSKVLQDSEINLAVPAGVSSMRVEFLDSSKSMAFVAVTGTDGKLVFETFSNTADRAGLGSWQGNVAGAWGGVGATDLEVGQKVQISVLGGAAWRLVMTGAATGLKTELKVPESISAWKRDSALKMTLAGSFAASASTDFAKDGWSLRWGAPVQLWETQANTNPGVEPVPMKLWEDMVWVPFH